MIWRTTFGDEVTSGDLVALSVLKHSDAVGRIVAETDNGHVQCALIRGGNRAAGVFVAVEPDQLLVKVYR